MIEAIGVVYFNHKIYNTSAYAKQLEAKIKKTKNKYKDAFKVVSISDPFQESDGIFVRVSCSYQIYMTENFHCKSIDDYTGQVFPTLRERLPYNIIATKIHSLTKVYDSNAKRVRKI
ncbi:hypothetical protein [Niallia sp. 03133]|uniref:hypothetical protein n=1 Tax=Niallia sp. 03133 TaxID=3458060 RepID=UPI004043C2E0